MPSDTRTGDALTDTVAAPHPAPEPADVVAAYRAADVPLTTVLDAVPPAAWASPSPCEGWTAADVVAHLVSTQRDFLQRHGVALWDAPDVAADPAAAWRRHSAGVLAALADPAVPARAFDGHFGPTTVGQTLTRFYVFDMVVHRWDVARGTGVDTLLTGDELDLVETSADGFGEALHMAGVCAPALEPPAGADRATRVLARLGRRA